MLIKILYAREMFNCFKVFALLERDVAGGDLVNCEVLCIGKFSSLHIMSRAANLPGTLEVKSVCPKHGFAKG